MSEPSPELSTEIGASTENLDAAAATSSSAEPEGVKSLLDLVSTALEEPEASPAADEPGKDVSAQKPEDGAQPAKAGDPTEDELKLLSPNAQTRIRELVQRRKEVEGVVAEKEQLIEQYRPNAERMVKLDEYMQQNRITPDQMNNTMAIAALVQTGRYQEALQALGPVYEQLLQLTGNVLPKELQQEVDAGYITTARAIELQRERMANQTARDREKQAATQREQEAEKRENDRMETLHKERTRVYGESATTWENAKKASDPDWSTKQKLVSDIVEGELRRIVSTDPSKLPTDAQAVHKFLDSILERVEGHLKPFRPKPTARDHETGRPASSGAKSKPASLMDAVNDALG